MADPILVPITPANSWVNVGTSTNCRVTIMDSSPTAYYYTHVTSGSTAPSGLSLAKLFDDAVEITNSPSADIYIYAKGSAGSVEVETL